MKSLSHRVLFVVCSSFAASLACASEIQEIEPPDASGPFTRAGSGGGRSGAVEGGSGGAPVSAPAGGTAGTNPGGSGGSFQAQGGGGALAGSSGEGGEGASGAGGPSAAAGSSGAAGSAGSAGGAGEEPSPCATRSFEYEAEGAALESVHVSGSFNEWAEPGTALVYDAISDRWSVEIGLPAGNHQYKFVLDGSEWITDPKNPDTSADGYGGVNSVVVVTCP